MIKFLPIQREKVIDQQRLRIFLFVFACVLFGNTLFNDYNMDDELVTRHHRLTSKGIRAIPEIFTSPYYQDKAGYAYEYRPVVLMSFAIEHALFGESPFISHLLNLLLYGGCVLVLFSVLSTLFHQYNLILPLTAALLFIAHPLHTEVVASIKNRDEILALLFALLSWMAAIRYVQTNQWGFVLFMILSFLLSLLSKMSTLAMAFLMPFSLVCFFRPVFRQLIVISGFLAIIVFLLAPLHQLSYKCWLSFVVLVTPLLIKTILDGDINIQEIILRVGQIFKPVDNNVAVSADKSSNVNQGILKIRPVVMVLLSCVLILPVILSVYLHYAALAFWSILLLTVLLILSGSWSNVICISALALSTAIVSIVFNSDILYKTFVLLATTRAFSQPHHVLLRNNIIWVIVMAVASFFLGFGAIVFSVIALAIYYYTARRSVFLLPYLLLIALAVIKLFKVMYYLQVVTLVAMAVGATVYLRTRLTALGYTILIVVFLGVSAHQLLFVLNTPQTFEKVSNAVKLSPAFLFRTERPIDFVEMPLRYDSPAQEKIGTSAYVLAEYLKLLFFPYPMRFYYGYAQIEPVSMENLQSVVSITIHFLMLLAAILLIRSHAPLSFGIVFYLASISIFSNLLYPVVGVMAERFAFAASIGFCISLSYLLMKIFHVELSAAAGFRFNIPFAATLLLVLLTYSVVTISRNTHWKNHLTLMRHDIKYLDKSAHAHNLLASHLMDYSLKMHPAENVDAIRREAIMHYRRAIEIYPEFFNAWYDLARVYQLMSRLDSAYICYQKVHEMDSMLSKATINLALIAEYRGDMDTAIKYYEKVIRNNPYVKEAYANLSYLYFRLGRNDKSIETNLKAIAYNDQWSDPYENIARVYYSMNDTARAKYYLNEAQKRKQKSAQ